MEDQNVQSKAALVREFLAANPKSKNRKVVEALATQGVDVAESYVADVRRRKGGGATRRRKKAKGQKTGEKRSFAEHVGIAKFPRHSLEKALRIPRAILEQNAGKECSTEDAARFVGISSPHGPFMVEVASGIKYGLLERTEPGKIRPTDLARKILRPQNPSEELEAIRDAVLRTPGVSDVYKHYRGENLPADRFFEHALEDTFGIPNGKIAEFSSVLLETLQFAHLVENHNDKMRVIDFSKGTESAIDTTQRMQELGEGVRVDPNDTCFVMMPFASPHGDYYSLIYEPAIRKSGLRPVRADSSIFGAGKIMDQIWSGIHAARILVAELTTKNPNVFYELGLAHALRRPVVLVSSNEDDVPFDLKHIRVIYYDVNDPFWGTKLLDKIAENILSAISDPEEAIFKGKDAER